MFCILHVNLKQIPVLFCEGVCWGRGDSWISIWFSVGAAGAIRLEHVKPKYKSHGLVVNCESLWIGRKFWGNVQTFFLNPKYSLKLLVKKYQVRSKQSWRVVCSYLFISPFLQDKKHGLEGTQSDNSGASKFRRLCSWKQDVGAFRWQ